MTKPNEEDKTTEEIILGVYLDTDPRLEGPPGLENLIFGGSIGEALEGADLERVVDADLKQFARYYRKVLGNTTLSDFERAAIKTYLWWKTHKTNARTN